MQSQINFSIRKRPHNKENVHLKDKFSRKYVKLDNVKIDGCKILDTNLILKNQYAFSTSIQNFKIIERNFEIKYLTDFINDHLKHSCPGSLYVSGPPGTGKTMSINHILNNVFQKHDINRIMINCMSLNKYHEVFDKIYNILSNGLKLQTSNLTKIINIFKSHFQSNPSKMNLIIIDEIDHLKTKKNEVLLKVFELASLKNSNIIIIGISNTLDMIDSILPQIKCLSITPPNILKFLPYTDKQIMYIFQNRFSQANIDLNENLFETSALEFCSKKVSALNGDIRIALDACRKALEKFDITPANILTEKSNNAPKHFVKKVTMDELSQILPNKDINLTQYKCNLSINQKILLASLIKLIKGNNDNHDVLMNKAYKNYTIICGKKKLTKMSYLDFLTSCELLEDQKLLQITRLFNGLTKKIQIKGTVKDIEKGLQDQGLLSNIMQ
ncbi:unnamed protein product [Gordionus sp. m RMFG-2023]